MYKWPEGLSVPSAEEHVRVPGLFREIPTSTRPLANALLYQHAASPPKLSHRLSGEYVQADRSQHLDLLPQSCCCVCLDNFFCRFCCNLHLFAKNVSNSSFRGWLRAKLEAAPC